MHGINSHSMPDAWSAYLQLPCLRHQVWAVAMRHTLQHLACEGLFQCKALTATISTPLQTDRCRLVSQMLQHIVPGLYIV